MNESGALDERLRTYVMQSFEGVGEHLPEYYKSMVTKRDLTDFLKISSAQPCLTLHYLKELGCDFKRFHYPDTM
ncbi:MAG: hypothetical protein GY702_07360 [Desulfobulbaceae bacterium]|nr:hypothetical protein [Desulfobulbaceae bacterium]